MNTTRTLERVQVTKVENHDVVIVRLSYAEAQELLDVARCERLHGGDSGARICSLKARETVLLLGEQLEAQGVGYL